jgi:hypothetical protein
MQKSFINLVHIQIKSNQICSNFLSCSTGSNTAAAIGDTGGAVRGNDPGG